MDQFLELITMDDDDVKTRRSEQGGTPFASTHARLTSFHTLVLLALRAESTGSGVLSELHEASKREWEVEPESEWGV